jgi:hypothetical protein
MASNAKNTAVKSGRARLLEARRGMAIPPLSPMPMSEEVVAAGRRRREGGCVTTRVRGMPLGWLGVVVGVVLLWHQALFNGISGDVFWQWTAGRWMLAHHRVVTADPFSYTLHGHPWFDQEWGFELLLAAVMRLIGPVTFWLFSAGLSSLALLAVVALVRRRGAGWTATGTLALVVALVLTAFLKDRPQEFSYVFFPLLLWILTVARQQPRWLVLVPVMVGVWANIHGSFLLGLLVVLLEALWAWVPVAGQRIVTLTLNRRHAVATLGASAVAVLVNPHGFGLYGYTWANTFNPIISAVIQEWQSPNFHSVFLLLVVAGPLAATLLWLAFGEGQANWSDVVLTGGLLVATLHAVRFLPYWAEAWAALAPAFRPWSLWSRRLPWVIGVPLAVVLGAVWWAGRVVPPGTPTAVPARAVTYLQHHPGRVFSRYRWGDYLIFRGVPVFIDGRTNLYAGTGVLGEYLALRNLTRDPDPILHRYHVEYVLWPPETPLSVFLSHDRRWRLVWHSATADIFRRRD